MDVFDRISQLIDEDSSMSTDEMGDILVKEGFCETKDSLTNFFRAIGIKEE